MLDASDEELCKRALAGKLVTQAQVDRALELRASLERYGARRNLGEVLVGEGYLSSSQLGDLQTGTFGATPPTRPEEPTRLGTDLRAVIPGYELAERLGAGGMGEVYKARQVGLDRWVALKLMRPELAQDPEFIRRFLIEARTAGKLRHENLVSALECGVANGRYFMVMELVEGRSLDAVLRQRGRIPEREALGWVRQVADGLDHAWFQRIIHRDIKPQNLMLTPEGVIKILDLGLCKSVRTDANLTATGTLNCTPTHASPEQARGEKDVDTRSDIYSLGVTLYQLVTGRLPFESHSAGDLLVKHATERPVPPSRHCPSLSREADQLVLQMLEKQRERRPSNPAALAAQIRAILATPVEAPAARPTHRASARRGHGEPAPAPPRSRRVLLGAVLLTVAFVVILAGLLTSGRGTSGRRVAKPVSERLAAPGVAAPAPDGPPAALLDLERLSESQAAPEEILLACENLRLRLRGSPFLHRVEIVERRALERKGSGASRKLDEFMASIRVMTQGDHAYRRMAEIEAMFAAAERMAGARASEVRAERDVYRKRAEEAPQLIAESLEKQARALEAAGRWGEAAEVLERYPAEFAGTQPALDLARFHDEMVRKQDEADRAAGLLLEGGGLEVLEKSGDGTVSIGEVRGLARAGRRLEWSDARTGDVLRLGFTLPVGGERILRLGILRSPDAGTVKLSVNGKEISPPLGLHSLGVEIRDSLHKVPLKKGRNELRVEIAAEAPAGKARIIVDSLRVR